MQYTVFSSEDLSTLIYKVNDALKNGWVLQGGISSSISKYQGSYAVIHAQAMIKESK